MVDIREGGRANTRNWTFSWTGEIGITGTGISFILNETTLPPQRCQTNVVHLLNK